MTNSRLTFGEMTTYGELARGIHPADELGLQMALALGQPDLHAPPFAVVAVLLDGSHIGWLGNVRWVWGGAYYEFRSISGNTHLIASTKDAILDHLQEVLQLAS